MDSKNAINSFEMKKGQVNWLFMGNYFFQQLENPRKSKDLPSRYGHDKRTTGNNVALRRGDFDVGVEENTLGKYQETEV